MVSASFSLLQTALASPEVSDILDSNKTPRFAKEVVENFFFRKPRAKRLYRPLFSASYFVTFEVC